MTDLLPTRVQNNLDNISEFMKEKNMDWVHSNVGEEGSTKSSLALLMAVYIDPDFDVEKQVAMSGKDFRVKASNLEPFKPIIYDEGIEGLFSRESMTKENRKTVKFLRKDREMNLFQILCTPNFVELDKAIREDRVKSVTRCVKQGWGWFYGSKGKDKYLEREKWPDPPFRAGWPDPAEKLPEIWQEYQELKQEDIKELEEEEESDEEKEWLSVGEVSDRLDVHPDTVRSWCDSGKLNSGRLPNGDRRIPGSELMEIIDERQNEMQA